ncbi:GtrA family protein [Paenibacillus thailandensis]|uniref:GtrA family protein n=1 Tax=Paenibacillus thailandensis TaxID=393250 RepID=A0ABW5QS81_9BACL
MKDLISWFWSKQFFRFLVVGGSNVAFGYVITLLLYFLFRYYNISSILNFVAIDIPLFLSTIIGIPIAYTTQTFFVFKEKWSFKKLIAYPITLLPNILIQQITYFIFDNYFDFPGHLQQYIAYGLATITPIPIMFILVKFIVTNKRNEKAVEVTE